MRWPREELQDEQLAISHGDIKLQRTQSPLVGMSGLFAKRCSRIMIVIAP